MSLPQLYRGDTDLFASIEPG